MLFCFVCVYLFLFKLFGGVKRLPGKIVSEISPNFLIVTSIISANNICLISSQSCVGLLP